ncbi:hypothetical protein [Brevundimonas mediterranea]|jgi:hypothetical protein|uniref:hypothetical protein n=1 Tax=Brevundimonas mediterranea TaxID=74329 RepID=UPI001211F041|nr:MAG: hypothetical protein EON87_00360 [Brevundimonas sp.]
MVELDIHLNAVSLTRLKSGLRQTAPNIKSSHRVEALARGLGYRSNAELRARLVETRPARRVDTAAFTGYLSEHGFDASAALLLRAAGHAITLDVMDRDDRLHKWGWGCGRPERRDGRWETPYENYDRFLRYRDELTDIRVADQVLRAIAMLSRVPATRTIRPDTDSYRLKHIAENFPCDYPDGELLGPEYVANGPLIVAASHFGFRYRTGRDPQGYEWPNVTFNMSQSHLLELDIVCRPNGARAQARRRRQEAGRYGSLWPQIRAA